MTSDSLSESYAVLPRDDYDEFCQYIKKWHDKAVAAHKNPSRGLPFIDPDLGIVLERGHGDALWSTDRLVIHPVNDGYYVLRAGGRNNAENLFKDEFFSTHNWALRYIFFQYANFTALALRQVSANWYFLDLPLADTFCQEETGNYKYTTSLIADPTHYYITGSQRARIISHYITRPIPELDALVATADPPRP